MFACLGIIFTLVSVSVMKTVGKSSLLNERKVGVPLRSDSTSTTDSDLLNDHRGINSSPMSKSSAASSIAFENNAMKRQLFKTKICRHNLIGRCKYNENCFFAHAAEQIVPRIDFRKTKLCSKTNCHDPNCLYAHNADEIRDPYAPLCPDWATKGACGNGTACKFSHNLTHLEELALTSSTTRKHNKSPSDDNNASNRDGLLTPPGSDEHLESYSSGMSTTGGGSTPQLDTESSEELSAEELVKALVQMLSAGGNTTQILQNN